MSALGQYGYGFLFRAMQMFWMQMFQKNSTVVRVAQLCEYTKKPHSIMHFKGVNFIPYELYLI